jgi:indole-3-glycerol phosphate synthase
VADFLSSVIERKISELPTKKGLAPAESLRRDGPNLGVRDFCGAVTEGGIIAEIKRRSPTVRSFRQDGPPEDLARTYERNGACAISIVTDEHNFGTSLSDLKRARSAVSLPVLAKDFVIDGYQVREMWAAGADAVLLITRILSTVRLRSLLDLVTSLGMSALVECHSEEDIRKAAECGARIFGINNRDLRTLEVSSGTTHRLAPLVPSGAQRVCESGIQCRADIDELHDLGVHAFLVGGALLNSEDPGVKLCRLLGAEARREQAG